MLVELGVLRPGCPSKPEHRAAFRGGYGDDVRLDDDRITRFGCVRALEDVTAVFGAGGAHSPQHSGDLVGVRAGLGRPARPERARVAGRGTPVRSSPPTGRRRTPTHGPDHRSTDHGAQHRSPQHRSRQHRRQEERHDDPTHHPTHDRRGRGHPRPRRGLSGCSGFTGGGGDDDADGAPLTFTTWASESGAGQPSRSWWPSSRPSTTARPSSSTSCPTTRCSRNIDAQLSTGDAPDVFRVDYGHLGGYSQPGPAARPRRRHIDDEDAFSPRASGRPSQYEGAPYGVPHQTDTSALLVYTPTLLAAAGITDLPTKPRRTPGRWDEFGDVATKLRASLPADQFPFGVQLAAGGMPRWLSWLFEAGGPCSTDLTARTPASRLAEATEALDFTQTFFEQGWVAAEQQREVDDLRRHGVQRADDGDGVRGSFLVPELAGRRFDWGGTYRCPSTSAARPTSAATPSSRRPPRTTQTSATEFRKFMAAAEAMTDLLRRHSLELPTRTDSRLPRPSTSAWTAPSVMPVFVDQATTDPPPRDVTAAAPPRPQPQITIVMHDQLEAAFTGRAQSAPRHS